MTIQTETTEMQKILLKQATYYLERESRWQQAVPVYAIPRKRYVEFYKVPQPEPVHWAFDHGAGKSIETGLEIYTVMVPNLPADFTYSEEEIRVTDAYGLPVISQQTKVGYKQMARRIAQLVYQGVKKHTATSTIFVDGLMNVSSPSGLNSSTYTTTKWNASGGPQATVLDMAGALITDSLDPPYTLVLGDGTHTGLFTTITSTAKYNITQVQDILSSPNATAPGGGGATLFYEDHGTDSGNVTYPLPAATANNNVALLLKPNPDYFRVLLAMGPTLTLDNQPDTVSRRVRGHLDWMGTIIVPEPKAVCKHTTIDYA